MILKHADDRLPPLVRLEALLRSGRIPADRVEAVQRELRIAHAGLRGEREAAYKLDFFARDAANSVLIHDLRLDLGDGRAAQIDHLLIHHTWRFYLLESKHFSHGLKITEHGEFLRWNEGRRNFDGIPSPIEQNGRHALVLTRVMESMDLPAPTIRSFVLISDQARIDRPRTFDTSSVVKADQFLTAMQRDLDEARPLALIGGMLKGRMTASISEVGKRLVALHRPLEVDYLQRLGIRLQQKSTPEPVASVAAAVRQATPVGMAAAPATAARLAERPGTGAISAPVATSAVALAPPPELPAPAPRPPLPVHACRICRSVRVAIVHGRYGYYFRCADCHGNTPIRLECGQPGHAPRIRKEGQRFWRECAACGTSLLFHENAAA